MSTGANKIQQKGNGLSTSLFQLSFSLDLGAPYTILFSVFFCLHNSKDLPQEEELVQTLSDIMKLLNEFLSLQEQLL